MLTKRNRVFLVGAWLLGGGCAASHEPTPPDCVDAQAWLQEHACLAGWTQPFEPLCSHLEPACVVGWARNCTEAIRDCQREAVR